ncbi:hypothetical protein CEXT_680711 [Caerostris extrusa]|uniref:Uncharacterized protein n=1 Tax=Caerostris extrusa TaxID=172846 RepID=A0AAV4W005_CAEEX|nr:hypothetical protein CEXT_680711 [Caerostris extrusa]
MPERDYGYRLCDAEGQRTYTGQEGLATLEGIGLPVKNARMPPSEKCWSQVALESSEEGGTHTIMNWILYTERDYDCTVDCVMLRTATYGTVAISSGILGLNGSLVPG